MEIQAKEGHVSLNWPEANGLRRCSRDAHGWNWDIRQDIEYTRKIWDSVTVERMMPLIKIFAALFFCTFRIFKVSIVQIFLWFFNLDSNSTGFLFKKLIELSNYLDHHMWRNLPIFFCTKSWGCNMKNWTSNVGGTSLTDSSSKVKLKLATITFQILFLSPKRPIDRSVCFDAFWVEFLKFWHLVQSARITWRFQFSMSR